MRWALVIAIACSWAPVSSGFRAFGHQQGAKRKLADGKDSDDFKLRSEPLHKKIGAKGAAAVSDDPNDRLHILFSTSCNEFQHWQAEVVVNSAMRVGQKGKITQIVVGCDEREDKGVDLKDRVLTHSQGDADNLVGQEKWAMNAGNGIKFNRLFAPSIEQAKKFPWYNKPWSFKYFLMHGNLEKDEIVVIIDPDEFFLEPLTIGHKKSELLMGMSDKYLAPIVDDMEGVIDIPKVGTAVTQVYGIGGHWIHKFDRNGICGKESYCATMGMQEANNYYSAGPPYLMHELDFRAMMPTWWDFMAPVYKKDPQDIQADMYAYTMAAAHHNIKHVSLLNYMVSCPSCNGEHAWSYIDKLEHLSCHDPLADKNIKKPTFLHAAQHFKVCSGGDHPKDFWASATCDISQGSELWSIHKGHVPSTILNCDEPLLTRPPDDIFSKQKDNHGKRQAFIVCAMTHQINNMLTDYRKAHCPNGWNKNYCVRTILEGAPQRDAKDGEDLINPTGFDLARLQCGSTKKVDKDGKATFEQKEFTRKFAQLREKPHDPWKY